MFVCTTRTTARVAARLTAVVLIGIGVAAATVATAEASALTEPTAALAEPLTPVSEVSDQLLEPLTSASALGSVLPSSTASDGSPALPSPGSAPGSTAAAMPGGQAEEPSSPSGRASAGGEDLVAVDADVEGLLGLCVRIPSGGANPRADLSVLDRDLIAELSTAGVPLRELVEPCPPGVAAPTGATPTTGASSTVQAASAMAAIPMPDPTTSRLAFTGAEVVPTMLLAVGLLWLGGVLTLASRRLATVRQGS